VTIAESGVQGLAVLKVSPPSGRGSAGGGQVRNGAPSVARGHVTIAEPGVQGLALRRVSPPSGRGSAGGGQVRNGAPSGARGHVTVVEPGVATARPSKSVPSLRSVLRRRRANSEVGILDSKSKDSGFRLLDSTGSWIGITVYPFRILCSVSCILLRNSGFGILSSVALPQRPPHDQH